MITYKWSTFCEYNHQSQSAASYISKMRKAEQHFAKDLESSKGQQELLLLLSPSVLVAVVSLFVCWRKIFQQPKVSMRWF